MHPNTTYLVGATIITSLVIFLAAPVSAENFFPVEVNGVDGYYIVLLDPGVTDPEEAAEKLASKFGAQVTFIYRELYPGFEAEMDEQTAMAMAADPSVKRIHQDIWFVLEDVISGPVDQCGANPTGTNVRDLPSIPPCGGSPSCAQELLCPQPGGNCIDNWGLDRIDQVLGLAAVDQEFNYRGAGTGVTVYVIDGGIHGTNREFLRGTVSRVEPGVDTSSPCNLCPPGTEGCCPTANEDCFFGHGSHVGGILGGGTFGVAKDVTLVPFRFGSFANAPPECNQSPSNQAFLSGFNRALELIAQLHTALMPTAVVSMSVNDCFGRWADVNNPDTQEVRDSMIALASRDNILIVQSAGNQGRSGTCDFPGGMFTGDACVFTFGDESDYSGLDAAAIARIVVVAGFDPDLGQFDAGFSNASNWGPCVDIWAPASDIVSAGGHVNDPVDNRICRLTGTSMAAPHVSGVAALLLEEQPDTRPDQLKASLVEWATYSSLGLAAGHPIGPGSPNTRVRRAEDVVFEDGFNFDLSRWSSSLTAGQGTTLSVCEEATMPRGLTQPNGEPNGLCVGLAGDAGAQAYVVDERPVAEASYYATFFADYGGLSMQANDDHVIFKAEDGVGWVFWVRQRGDGFLKLHAADNAGGAQSTPWIDHGIHEGSRPVMVSFQAGSPGVVSISVDGVIFSESLSLQNGTRRVEEVALGAFGQIDASTTGTLRIDTFGSWTAGIRGEGGTCHPAVVTYCEECCNA